MITHVMTILTPHQFGLWLTLVMQEVALGSCLPLLTC